MNLQKSDQRVESLFLSQRKEKKHGSIISSTLPWLQTSLTVHSATGGSLCKERNGGTHFGGSKAAACNGGKMLSKPLLWRREVFYFFYFVFVFWFAAGTFPSGPSFPVNPSFLSFSLSLPHTCNFFILSFSRSPLPISPMLYSLHTFFSFFSPSLVSHILSYSLTPSGPLLCVCLSGARGTQVHTICNQWTCTVLCRWSRYLSGCWWLWQQDGLAYRMDVWHLVNQGSAKVPQIRTG